MRGERNYRHQKALQEPIRVLDEHMPTISDASTNLTGDYPVVIRYEVHGRTPYKTLYGVLHIEEFPSAFQLNVAFCVSWIDCKATAGAVLPERSGSAEFEEIAEAVDFYRQLVYNE